MDFIEIAKSCFSKQIKINTKIDIINAQWKTRISKIRFVQEHKKTVFLKNYFIKKTQKQFKETHLVGILYWNQAHSRVNSNLMLLCIHQIDAVRGNHRP